MTKTIGLPAQDGLKLARARATFGLGEVNGDLEASRPRRLKSGREQRDVALGRITTEVNGDDPTISEARGERDNFVCLGERITTV